MVNPLTPEGLVRDEISMQDMFETVDENELVDGENGYFLTGCRWDNVNNKTFIDGCVKGFGMYKNGYLYFGAFPGECPSWYLEAMTLMDYNVKRIEADEMKRQREEAERRKH